MRLPWIRRPAKPIHRPRTGLFVTGIYSDGTEMREIEAQADVENGGIHYKATYEWASGELVSMRIRFCKATIVVSAGPITCVDGSLHIDGWLGTEAMEQVEGDRPSCK